MDFFIDLPPPAEEEIIKERERTSERLKAVKNKDMIATSIIILVTSAALAFIVYSLTGNVKFAGISAVIYPVTSIVLNLLGITANVGFRSAAQEIVDLNNKLIGLKPISKDNNDVELLGGKYKEIKNYTDQVKQMGRDFVNRELMMFWEWDTSTQAKTAQVRSYLNRAKESIQSEVMDENRQETEKMDLDGFEINGEEKKE